MKSLTLGTVAVLGLLFATAAVGVPQEEPAAAPSFRPEWAQAIPEGGEDETPILIAFVEEEEAAETDEVPGVADPETIGLHYVRISLSKDAIRAVKRLAREYERAPQGTALPADPAQREAIVRDVTAFPTYILADRYGNELFRGNGTTLTGDGLVRDAARACEDQSERDEELTEHLAKAEELLDKRRTHSAIQKLMVVTAFGGWPQAVTAEERLESLQQNAEDGIQDALGMERESDARQRLREILEEFGALPGIPGQVADAQQELSKRGATDVNQRRANEEGNPSGAGE